MRTGQFIATCTRTAQQFIYIVVTNITMSKSKTGNLNLVIPVHTYMHIHVFTSMDLGTCEMVIIF